MSAVRSWLETGCSRGPWEVAQSSDAFYSYCLWEYRPVAPIDGKWRAANLLYHSFDQMGVGPRGFELLERIRDAMGQGNTVWGVKRARDRMSWELYFYDYRRRARSRSMSLLLDAIRPLVRCDIQPSEWRHYFMFSIDLDTALLSGERPLDEIHMYIGNVGSAVSSGISYSLTPSDLALENFYFFFDPSKHRDEIAGKIACSAFVDTPQIPLDEILWPELLDCGTVCIANKRKNDCVYFSGVRVDPFLRFLERMQYPEALTSFVRDNRSRLDHLLFDVGIDYRITNGRVEVVKSAYYGNV